MIAKTAVCFSSVLIALSILLPDHAGAAELYVGASTVDITPAMPVALDGQMQLRVAKTIETPLTANVVVLDSREGNTGTNVSVFVSCDLVAIPKEFLKMIRDAVSTRVHGIDPDKIIVNATHTHTAAVVRDGWYTIPKEVTQVKSYQQFAAGRIGEAILKAWAQRKPGRATWGMSYAKVAYNRRAVYADGTAKMYGNTSLPEFRGIEGVEDQSINTLFFWNESGKLIAACVNVSSPAQVVESRSTVNADYWYPVRIALQKKLGTDLVVLGWIGAAGDQSPHVMYNNAAELRMSGLINGSSNETAAPGTKEAADAHLHEIARRVTEAVVQTYEAVKGDRHKDVRISHTVTELHLPARMVTKEEYDLAKKMSDEDRKDPKQAVLLSRRIAWNEEVMKRFDNQKINPKPTYPAEVHVMRIGDVVLCTNPFELFTEFGVQMKSRSKALQTIVLQLAGPGTYLPTKQAVKDGHYSAIIQSNQVGPEGGQVLVDNTVEMINKLWP
ncbi:hypothetical protein [Dyadobacter sp. LHD-138]|uniref:hypothetical protein n=1 Tax=Dyadobacter sp. LHD-138 TaxID=3071413 RepID=UPI0027E0B0B0|nr:hypothetical protein [Dyadobacter sp. LHD-138]MDQ6477168.1 hypothetical protein [Dyadobacter sp. LHD-138]